MYRRVCKQVYMCVGDDEGVRRNLVLIDIGIGLLLQKPNRHKNQNN